ncbi:MAG: Panacea domain-containing protein [Fimbriimonadales bacterium]|nr:Panacea domain-containing protein [Fimbriimonadales bacterium]
MDERLNFVQRMAILTELVQRLGEVGRTSLMKLAYLLQTVKQVPLGYRFQFYLYGPYDPQVLSDVSVAEFWGALQEEYHAYGCDSYGYKIRPTEEASRLTEMEHETVQRYREAIEWAVQEFGNYNAAQMELIATLVWIDREFFWKSRKTTMRDLVQAVRNLKPHFSEREVEQIANNLHQKGILLSVVSK